MFEHRLEVWHSCKEIEGANQNIFIALTRRTVKLVAKRRKKESVVDTIMPSLLLLLDEAMDVARSAPQGLIIIILKLFTQTCKSRQTDWAS